MPKPFWWLLVLVLGACSGDPGTGPADVHWDRDICERCRMVVSDRHFAAEVRVFPQGKRSKVYYFDDIGCAVVWLKDTPWKDDPNTQIWVTDHRTGNWIDARTAIYVPGKITPMEYGLGAQSDPAPNGLTFEQATRHIFDVEERFNAHGVQLLERLKEQAKRRQSAGKDTQQQK